MSTDELHRWARVAVLRGRSIEGLEDLQITPRASVRSHVSREHSTACPRTMVSEWINENHLIWTLCADLAESDADQDWTRGFNTHYSSQ
ncbi:hypothetical protein PDIP_80730 [Penicillium digitatum Pd1]|uniref:Uncharacterized protein n=1 Tax=Penicillium digitatum (strain Pd1 / CECT 20795) TaxID=1170230 RepID=K9FTD7_PEND1|nr:hypothetical protein PDIP_80730 [Penicillium digitatum Pd1]EKV06043.1 hypothetical protein PDIP_80730 [Penicillium digitatum Pd1]